MTARLLDQPHKHFVGPLSSLVTIPPQKEPLVRVAHNRRICRDLLTGSPKPSSQVGDFDGILMSPTCPERTSEKGSIA
jgi:hypothetical protein